MTVNSIQDILHRPLRDLRISVIDRCNFRCNYCMPGDLKSPYSFLNPKDRLTFEEIFRLAGLFVDLGVSKIRLTGGEPLLRPNLPDLVGRLRSLGGIKDLALTTNGSLLYDYAPVLKAAGLNRVTVSLDTLDARTFHKMNGRQGGLKNVLEGISRCEELNFESLKINVVVQRGVNDHQILDLVKYFKGTKAALRFIEYMDVGNCNHWDMRYVVPTREVIARISEHFPLKLLEAKSFGEVAARYAFADGSGEVGFISSVTRPFCGTCIRVRISADGKLYTCLFAGEGLDLRTPLREGSSDAELLELIRITWQKRADRYSELRTQIRTTAPQTHHKVEMFQIGG